MTLQVAPPATAAAQVCRRQADANPDGLSLPNKNAETCGRADAG